MVLGCNNLYLAMRSFKCGLAYHAPTECEVIKQWLSKCEDDSETANYISAHTKDVSSPLSVIIIITIIIMSWEAVEKIF